MSIVEVPVPSQCAEQPLTLLRYGVSFYCILDFFSPVSYFYSYGAVDPEFYSGAALYIPMLQPRVLLHFRLEFVQLAQPSGCTVNALGTFFLSELGNLPSHDLFSSAYPTGHSDTLPSQRH